MFLVDMSLMDRRLNTEKSINVFEYDEVIPLNSFGFITYFNSKNKAKQIKTGKRICNIYYSVDQFENEKLLHFKSRKKTIEYFMSVLKKKKWYAEVCFQDILNDTSEFPDFIQEAIREKFIERLI